MTSLVDVVRPSSKSLGYTYDIMCILAGSLFLALMSQVYFYLWFSPVPLTLQTLGVLMLGGVLGSKRGALSVLSYLAQGALGLPVFAGGSAGVLSFMGPTGGYLIGFVFAAYIVGYLLERGWQEKYQLTFYALALGELTILLLGAFWLSFFVGADKALPLGFYPFVIGGVLKALAAAALIPSGWRALSYFK